MGSSQSTELQHKSKVDKKIKTKSQKKDNKLKKNITNLSKDKIDYISI